MWAWFEFHLTPNKYYVKTRMMACFITSLITTVKDSEWRFVLHTLNETKIHDLQSPSEMTDIHNLYPWKSPRPLNP